VRFQRRVCVWGDVHEIVIQDIQVEPERRESGLEVSG
jgi:hypothetical protein